MDNLTLCALNGNARATKQLQALTNRVEKLDGVGNAYNIANILGDAGNFVSAADWFNASTGGMYTVSGNVATFTAKAQYGGLQTLENGAVRKFPLVAGHKYYIFGSVLTSSERVYLSLNASGGVGGVYSTGTGEWEFLDHIGTAPKDAEHQFTITDNGSDFGTEISVKQVGLIDLTECFGEGNEPALEAIRQFVMDNGGWLLSGTYTEEVNGEIPALRASVEDLGSKVKDFSALTAFIFGDSITATNSISADGSLAPVKTNWPTFAMEELGIKSYYNFAKDGSAYHDFDSSADYQTFYKQFQLAKSTGLTPDIIIVSLGTNDFQYPKTDTYDSVMQVADLSELDRTNLYGALRYCYWALREQYPNAVIFVATPIQRPDVGVFSSIREAIVKMAQTYCCHIIDAGVESGICRQFETWGTEGRYLKDGLHPKENGQRLMGHYYANCVKNAY